VIALAFLGLILSILTGAALGGFVGALAYIGIVIEALS
jgi:hypothetical protein